MSIRDKFNKALDRALKPSVKSEGEKYSFGTVDYTIPNIPCIIEKTRDPWVLYGENNLYPVQVNDLRNGSAIHNAILKTKTKMTAGEGFLINGAKTKEESDAKYLALNPSVKAEYDLFLKNPNNEENMEAVKVKNADDLQEQGMYAYEVVFNMDFSKIVRVKYVNVQNIRPSKMKNGKIDSYWYCRDWSKAKHADYKPVEIKAFDGQRKDALNQLVFEKVGKNEYFGELPYKGCLNWIMTDFKMSLYHLSSMDNGMNPGIWFKFYKVPKSESEKQTILDELKRKYQGATKTNKMVVTFSEGKDLAPDIQPMQVSNLDKQLLLLAELCDKKILTGHQLTSPLLAGVSVSGQIGGNTELQTAYNIFDKVAMEADRQHVERSYQRILDYNKVPVNITINPFKPFGNGQ